MSLTHVNDSLTHGRLLGRRAAVAAVALCALAGLTLPTAAASPSVGPPPDGSSAHWLQLSAGYRHTCGIQSDGTLWCWGSNTDGDLGLGKGAKGLPEVHVPTQVGSDDDWVAVSSNDDHTCGLQADHTLWCWGNNYNGEVGDGEPWSQEYRALVPTQVLGGAVWASVSTGSDFTCGIQVDASAWCWGDGDEGQLGDGLSGYDYLDVPTPQEVVGGAAWASVASGDDHSCALRPDATLWCWGANSWGQLGDGKKKDSASPVQAGSGGWTSATAGDDYTCALQSDQTAWCWGFNYDGQLGDGTTNPSSTPVRSVPGQHFSVISAGHEHTCGVLLTGRAWCWGENRYGQLGRGKGAGSGGMPPGPVKGSGSWGSVSAAVVTTCGLKANATAWCWGQNAHGQLGDGTTTRRYQPHKVESGRAD